MPTPCFVDPAAGDYHLLLSKDSLCIDAGDPTYSPGSGETDINGDQRVLNGRVDIGADEYNPEMASFWLSSKELKFHGKESGPNPQAQILSIRNRGGGTLNWVIAYDCDWVEVDPNRGSSTGDPNEVTLTVNIAGVTQGRYNCELTVSDPNAINNPQMVQVELHIFASDFDSDGDVDLYDFAVLASVWQSSPGDTNCDISKPKDGVIDELDLAVFCEDWLAGVE